MYLDGSDINTLPDGNYELTSESYCTNEENVKMKLSHSVMIVQQKDYPLVQ